MSFVNNFFKAIKGHTILSFNVSDEGNKKLQHMMENGGAETKRELLNEMMTVYAHLQKAKINGGEIGYYDLNGEFHTVKTKMLEKAADHDASQAASAKTWIPPEDYVGEVVDMAEYMKKKKDGMQK